MPDDGNGWREYQKLVLSELKRLDASIEKIGERMDNVIKHERNNRQQVEHDIITDVQRLSSKVHGLEIKCGIFGLLGGLLPVIALLLMKQL
tara:strand:+ start:2936 stop:3208 length:273 start_codon:yes stop_codon:yes gene_type:complete